MDRFERTCISSLFLSVLYYKTRCFSKADLCGVRRERGVGDPAGPARSAALLQASRDHAATPPATRPTTV